MVTVKGKGSIFPPRLLSQTHTRCRYYGQSEPREGGKGYSPIRNMMMMTMLERENTGNPCSLNLALHANFPNYWFGSSQIRQVHKNILRTR
jgi:hypothetical protein